MVDRESLQEAKQIAENRDYYDVVDRTAFVEMTDGQSYEFHLALIEEARPGTLRLAGQTVEDDGLQVEVWVDAYEMELTDFATARIEVTDTSAVRSPTMHSTTVNRLRIQTEGDDG